MTLHYQGGQVKKIKNKKREKKGLFSPSDWGSVNLYVFRNVIKIYSLELIRNCFIFSVLHLIDSFQI